MTRISDERLAELTNNEAGMAQIAWAGAMNVNRIFHADLALALRELQDRRAAEAKTKAEIDAAFEAGRRYFGADDLARRVAEDRSEEGPGVD